MLKIYQFMKSFTFDPFLSAVNLSFNLFEVLRVILKLDELISIILK